MLLIIFYIKTRNINGVENIFIRVIKSLT